MTDCGIFCRRIVDLYDVDFRKILSRLKYKSTYVMRKLQGKQAVYFLHIGKTGGSAVKTVLSRYPVCSRYACCLHRHEVSLRAIPAGDYVMFFLREPISRFVSGFYSRQRQGQPRAFVPWQPDERRAFAYFRTPNHLATALFSSDTEEKDRACRGMRSIGHVKSSYWDWFHNEEYFTSRLSDIFYRFSEAPAG